MNHSCGPGLRRGALAVVAAGAALALVASPARAATAPFVETFDTATPGTTLPPDFVESGPAIPAGGAADYSVQPAAPAGNALRAAISSVSPATGTTGVAVNRSAAVAFPAQPGNNFTVSTDFTIDSFSAGGSGSTINFGLAALGTDANFTSGSNYRLLYTPTTAGGTGATGKLTLSEIGSTGLTGTLTSTGTLTPAAGLSGTLTLSGTYVGSTLNLTGILVSGGNTLTVSGTDTAVIAGQFFGYRTAVNAQLGTGQAGPLTTSQTIVYDNFSVVPEPGTAGLLALAGVGLLTRRRRRR